MKSFATRFRQQTLGAPEREPRADFTQRVMTAIQQQQQPPHRFYSYRLPTAIAATILLTCSLFFLVNRTPRTEEQVMASQQWLLQTQAEDGLWHADDFGGNAHYTPALSALALLALRDQLPSYDLTDRSIMALAKSLPSQCKTQADAYNLTLATYALTIFAREYHRASALEPLKVAISTLKRLQTPSGGWSYDQSEGNTALTAWNAHILALNEPANSPHLKRALRWLKQARTPEGAFTYSANDSHTSPTLDALSASAFKAAGLPADCLRAPSKDPSYYEMFARAAARGSSLKNCEFRRQISAAYKGSGQYQSDGTWSPIGGNLYNNALAILTLAPPQL